jgi:hypothetical protein
MVGFGRDDGEIEAHGPKNGAKRFERRIALGGERPVQTFAGDAGGSGHGRHTFAFGDMAQGYGLQGIGGCKSRIGIERRRG